MILIWNFMYFNFLSHRKILDNIFNRLNCLTITLPAYLSETTQLQVKYSYYMVENKGLNSFCSSWIIIDLSTIFSATLRIFRNNVLPDLVIIYTTLKVNWLGTQYL